MKLRALGVAFLVLAGCGSSGPEAAPAVTEIQLPDRGGSTHELVLGPDGNVWVTQQDQAKLVRITPRGAVKAHSLPAGSGPHGIGFDRQGYLWLTLEFADEIVELDQSGRILNLYSTPPGGEGPHGLHVAGDGAVWWTAKAGGGIGRLDPVTRSMDVFPLPDSKSTPIFITEGCDGMYFTEYLGARIGRVTNDGTIKEWPTPTPASRPIGVAPRDCKIWFSEQFGHHFGMLDPATDEIREYPLAGATDTLASLAFDDSGTLWLQHITPDQFGRAGSDAEAGIFPLPTRQATMHRIIRGPGGKMWFTELAADKVGYFDPQR